eukprot:6361438-Amphidinium_carterae.1
MRARLLWLPRSRSERTTTGYITIFPQPQPNTIGMICGAHFPSEIKSPSFSRGWLRFVPGTLCQQHIKTVPCASTLQPLTRLSSAHPPYETMTTPIHCIARSVGIQDRNTCTHSSRTATRDSQHGSAGPWWGWAWRASWQQCVEA